MTIVHCNTSGVVANISQNSEIPLAIYHEHIVHDVLLYWDTLQHLRCSNFLPLCWLWQCSCVQQQLAYTQAAVVLTKLAAQSAQQSRNATQPFVTRMHTNRCEQCHLLLANAADVL
jgi:hypothetical protein